MKNYLKSLGEPISRTHFLISGVILAGLNLALLAAFLVFFVFFDQIEELVMQESKYQYLTMIVVVVFIIVSVKLWVDYGKLLGKRFENFKAFDKFKKILLVDLIGILPLLVLVLLKNLVAGLKYLANPSSVAGNDVANSLILVVALLVQIILVEVVALRRSKLVNKETE